MVANHLRPGIVDRVLWIVQIVLRNPLAHERLTVLKYVFEGALGNFAQSGRRVLSQLYQSESVTVVQVARTFSWFRNNVLLHYKVLGWCGIGLLVSGSFARGDIASLQSIAHLIYILNY